MDSTAAAAEWHGRLKDGARKSTIDEFIDWQFADPENAAAYAEVESAADWIRSVDATPELMALRSETLARYEARVDRQSWWRHWGMRPLMAACAALILTFGVIGWLSLRDPAATTQSYVTRLGERTDLVLADGSTVRLNAQSAVQITYTDKQRSLRLLRGQAFFRVAKDAARPFIVQAGDESITALGTEFDVRMDARRGLRVALLEGKVAVQSKARTTTILNPNDVLQSVGNRVSVSRVSDFRNLISWTEGVLLFADTPLWEALEDINRYAPTPIILDDPRLGSITISGTFHAGQSKQFLEAIELAFPVRISEQNEKHIVLSRAR